MSQGDHLSPDGLYRWDGLRWVPTDAVIPQPLSVAPPRAPGFGVAIAGGVVAILGAALTIAACVLPYAKFTDNSAPTTPSILNPGFPGGLWYAAEPVAVAVLAVAAGVTLMAMQNRTARILLAGALLAFGLQTFLLFVGYAGGAATGQSEQIGIGGPVGVIGGLAMIVAGGLGVASLGARAPSAPR